jgi:hypothetical protein
MQVAEAGNKQTDQNLTKLPQMVISKDPNLPSLVADA